MLGRDYIVLILADDCSEIRQRLERYESSANEVRIESASSVDEAVQITEKHSVDVILFEYDSTVADFSKDLGRLRDTGLEQPVIALVGKPDSELEIELLEAGASGATSRQGLTQNRLYQDTRLALAHCNQENGSRSSSQGVLDIPETVFEADLDFFITFSHRLTSELFAGTEIDINPGYNFLDFLVIEDQKRAQKHVKRLFEGEDLGIVEYVVEGHGEKEIHIFVEMDPIYQESVPVGVRIAVLNINRHRRAQAQRRRVEEQLLRSQKLEAVGLMSAGMAHDINNILTIISCVASEIALCSEEKETVDKNVDAIVSACKHGGELSKNLMSYVRDVPDQMRRFSLNHQIREVELLLSHTLNKNINVFAELETGPTFVNGSPSQFNHALMNICLNSAKAMGDQGELTLRTRRTQNIVSDDLEDGASKSETYIVVEVLDTGVGMDESTLKQATEPFFTTSSDNGGTGLGLTMVSNTVSELDGIMNIKSTPNVGTRVTLRIPAAPARTSMQVGTAVSKPSNAPWDVSESRFDMEEPRGVYPALESSSISTIPPSE